MGDAVFEKYIRNYLIQKGTTKVNDLQRQSKRFVSAKAHADIFKKLEETSFFTEREVEIFKRGRNSHPHTKAKNTDIVTYQISSGVEALIGYLYFANEEDRLNELMAAMVNVAENNK